MNKTIRRIALLASLSAAFAAAGALRQPTASADSPYGQGPALGPDPTPACIDPASLRYEPSRAHITLPVTGAPAGYEISGAPHPTAGMNVTLLTPSGSIVIASGMYVLFAQTLYTGSGTVVALSSIASLTDTTATVKAVYVPDGLPAVAHTYSHVYGCASLTDLAVSPEDGLPTALISTLANPLAAVGGEASSPDDPALCVALKLDPAQGFFVAPDRDGCTRTMMNGYPVQDSCFTTPGVMVNGRADYSGATPACPPGTVCGGLDAAGQLQCL